MSHFAAFFITQSMIVIGIVLGFQLYRPMVIELGIVAMAAVFFAYSIAEAVKKEEEDDA